MLHEVVQDIQQLDIRLFALVFSVLSEGQVHKESGGVLDGVVGELLSLTLQDAGDPLDKVELDHDGLGLSTK